jgi:hypothetical protein
MAGMTKESIQLKNVKVAWNMSEETTAFTATLYIDGAKVAYVKNEGTGGDNHPRFMDRELEKEFHEFCKSLPPEYLDDDDDEPYPMTYDSFIGQLLTEWISNDDWKKACKKGLVFRLKNDNGDQYRKTKGKYSPELASAIRERYGDDLIDIINERFI